MNIELITIIGAGFLSTIVAIVAKVNGDKMQKQLNETNKEIVTKTEKIIELQQTYLDELTGGNSYPHFEWYLKN